jgi:hypothetical protein
LNEQQFDWASIRDPNQIIYSLRRLGADQRLFRRNDSLFFLKKLVHTKNSQKKAIFWRRIRGISELTVKQSIPSSEKCQDKREKGL